MTAAIVAGCGGGQTTTTEPRGTARVDAAEAVLSAVQKRCRSEEVDLIGAADLALNRSCDRATMPLTLQMFDLAVLQGEVAAMPSNDDGARMCVCLNVACPEQEVNETIARVRATPGRERVAREEGASRTMTMLADHPCLDAVAATQVFQAGFNCGLLRGKDASIRAPMVEDLLRAYAVTGEPRTAALRCLTEGQ